MKNIKNSYFVRNNDVKFRSFGPSYLISYKEDLYEISLTAYEIWNSLDGQRTLNEIVKDIAGNYDVDKSELIDDIAEWIHEMVTIGLINEKK